MLKCKKYSCKYKKHFVNFVSFNKYMLCYVRLKAINQPKIPKKQTIPALILA